MTPQAREGRGGAAEVRLTWPQDIAMRSVEDDGTTTDGFIAESGVRGVRRVANSLIAKGLLERGAWWDEGSGYEYVATPAGRRWLGEHGIRLKLTSAPERAR